MLTNMNTVCGICEKRLAKRFRAAKGEKICVICCGEGREMTIDCPVDCSYLVARIDMRFSRDPQNKIATPG